MQDSLPARNRCRPRLQLEVLERRDTPSNLVELWPNDSFAQYQPLNNDTTYSISGRIDSLTDVDYYAFYATTGTGIRTNVCAVVATGNIHSEFDPTIGLFAPDGSLVAATDGAGHGSLGAARLTFTATQSGVWRIAVGHHGDLAFDGTAPVRTSWNPADPNNSGPGLHIGGYALAIVGGQKPTIVVNDPADGKVFYIDGNSPRMPSVSVALTGIVPAPNGSTRYSWQSVVGYRGADYPAIMGQRGPGRRLISPVYDPHTVVGSPEFNPDFEVGGVETIRGGRLLLTAQTQVGSLVLKASTPATGAARLQILGRNPDIDVVKAYVDELPVPASWPVDSQYSFASILRKMMVQESSVAQFDVEGVPLWSLDGRAGAGIVQLTNPIPTADQVWDWRRNIDAAVTLFDEKLQLAADRLDLLFEIIQSQLPVGPVVAPITGDMRVEEALRAYNALNNGNGVRDEFRAVREANAKLHLVMLTTGETSTLWEHVPISLRGTLVGDPNYVNNVLSQEEF